VEFKPEKFLTENTKAGLGWLGLSYALSILNSGLESGRLKNSRKGGFFLY